MADWFPGALTETLIAIRDGVVAGNAKAISDLADDTARRARVNASNGAHPRGTRTPSQPGEGPAVISGYLRRSLRVLASTADADSAHAVVGSDVVYARAQELGAVIRPVRARFLSWVDAKGTRYFRSEVTLPSRPFLRPAMPDRFQIEARYAVDIVEEVLARTGGLR